MKKIWGFVSAVLAGAIGGIIFALKFLVPEKVVFKGRIKLKQRGRGNEQVTDIRPEINVDTKREDKKLKRDERRANTKKNS